MSLLITVVWFLLATILGAVGFFIAPMVAAMIGNDELQERMGQYYLDLAMSTIRDAALVVRETGGLQLTGVSWDPKFGGDRASINGVVGHWMDPMAVKSTLAGKSFGIGLESASAYVSPVMAEFGYYGRKAQNNDRLGVIDTDDEETEQVALDYRIPRDPEIVDLREASKFLKGSCKRRWGALSNRWAELSQEKFHERLSLSQTLMWVAAFGVGVGLAFLLVKYGGDAGGIQEVAL